MNKIKQMLISIITALSITGMAIAGDVASLSVRSAVGETNSFTSVAQIVGYVDSIYITNSTAIPATITVSNGKEILLNAVVVTNSANYRIRLQECKNDGSLLTTYSKVMIYDNLTITSTQSSGTNTVKAVVRLENALTP